MSKLYVLNRTVVSTAESGFHNGFKYLAGMEIADMETRDSKVPDQFYAVAGFPATLTRLIQ
jgi:hypothetical protein